MFPPKLRSGRLLIAATLLPAVSSAQIDQKLANEYFAEAAVLCEREGGRLWGVSLCGPMVFADPQSQSIATNQPAPEADRPRVLGFVNAPVEWDGVRWSAYVWPMIPSDDTRARGRLMLHELFHRVQSELGLMVMGRGNNHLDEVKGRYWLRLEWRALARALESSDTERVTAIGDALVFREQRRNEFPGAAESERADELREGLAQYTATIAAAPSRSVAVADGVSQLVSAEEAPTFVRSFGYPSGTAYGLLLDELSPGWTRSVTPDSDLGLLLREAAKTTSAVNVQAAAERYGGSELRVVEEDRAEKQRIRIAELRARYVDGPALVVPRGRGAMLKTTGATPIPGEGTVFFEYRVTAEWGSLESNGILQAADGKTLRLPGPFQIEGKTLTGEKWKVVLSPGWIVITGERPGDFRVVHDPN